jgi:hypothetical protein
MSRPKMCSTTRALPWAVVVCPFRAERIRSASGYAKHPHVEIVNRHSVRLALPKTPPKVSRTQFRNVLTRINK